MSHSSLSSSLRPVDACAALDPMNELHVSTHLPKIEVRRINLSPVVTTPSELSPPRLCAPKTRLYLSTLLIWVVVERTCKDPCLFDGTACTRALALFWISTCVGS